MDMGSETPTAFFNKTYDEALALMVEAKDYIEWHERDDGGMLLDLDRLRLSRETMRVTSRLTQIMAWLFAQKAVVVGELSRAEAAAEPYTLSGHDVCAPGDPAHGRGLPAKMVDLLDRSHHLYVRVSRLDQLVRREAR
jgi:regulator of CtrA degradation